MNYATPYLICSDLYMIILIFYFQVPTGAESIGGQSICICLDIQVFQSATQLSGLAYYSFDEKSHLIC